MGRSVSDPAESQRSRQRPRPRKATQNRSLRAARIFPEASNFLQLFARPAALLSLAAWFVDNEARKKTSERGNIHAAHRLMPSTLTSLAMQREQDSESRPAAAGPSILDLIDEHHGLIYRYAVRLCGSPEEAEDLTQQTFQIAQEKVSQLRSADSARAWLCSILRSCHVRWRRRRRPLPAGALEFDLEAIAAKPESDCVDEEQVRGAVAALSEPLRQVVLMYYFQDCAYREIASELDIPIGTVMSRLSRARDSLRKLLLVPESLAAADAT